MLVQFSSVAQSCPTLCDPHGLQHTIPPYPSPTPSSVQFSCSVVSNSLQPHESQHPNAQSWLKLMTVESVMPSNHLSLCPSTPISSSPSFNLSQHQGLFKWVISPHHVAKVLEFQLQRQSFQWIFRTEFFRMDWLDLLAVQGTLKSLLLR